MVLTSTEELTVQEVARRTGFSEATLRYYERIGLIGPVRRDTSSGHRRYSPEVVSVLESLACLRSSGVGIEDMRRYLDLLARGHEAAAEQERLFSAHADRVAAEIQALGLRHRYLSAKAALWAAREQGDSAGEQAATAEVLAVVELLR